MNFWTLAFLGIGDVISPRLAGQVQAQQLPGEAVDHLDELIADHQTARQARVLHFVAFADRVIACDVVRHPDSASASDHFALVADWDC